MVRPFFFAYLPLVVRLRYLLRDALSVFHFYIFYGYFSLQNKGLVGDDSLLTTTCCRFSLSNGARMVYKFFLLDDH